MLLVAALIAGIYTDHRRPKDVSDRGAPRPISKTIRPAPVTLGHDRRVRIAKRVRHEELKRIRELDANIDRFDEESVSLLGLYGALYPERHAEYEAFSAAEGLQGHVRAQRQKRIETMKEISILLQFEEILTGPDHELVFDEAATAKFEAHLPYLVRKLNDGFNDSQYGFLKNTTSIADLRALLTEHRQDLWEIYDTLSNDTPEVVRNDTHYVARNELLAAAMREHINRRMAAVGAPDRQ